MKSNLEAYNSPQGGDVMGTYKINVSHGKAIEAAKASIDPGYSLEKTYEAGYIGTDSLIRGYVDDGVAVGHASPVGGKKIG